MLKRNANLAENAIKERKDNVHLHIRKIRKNLFQMMEQE